MILLFRDAALQSADIALLMTTVVVLAIATIIELRTRRIPNGICVATLALGVAILLYDQRVSAHLVGLLAAVLIGVSFYIYGSVGGGAVKLLFGIGLLAGVPAVLGATLVSLIAYGVFRLQQQPVDEDDTQSVHQNIMHSTPCLSIGAVAGLLLSLVVR